MRTTLQRALFTLVALQFMAPLSISAADIDPLNVECPHHEERIIVKFKNGVAKNNGTALLVKGRKVSRSFKARPNLQVIVLGAGERVNDAIAEYRKSGLVEYAEPDYKVQLFLSPNDPGFADGSQWAHQNIGQSNGVVDADIDSVEAWNTRTSASGIVVAVLDSGVQYTHEDLAANMWLNPGEQGTDSLGGNKATNGVDDDGNGYVDDVHGINAIGNTGNPADDLGHGTHVAGIIGAVGNNLKGGAGVAWDVRIMACRVVGSGGFVSDGIEGIQYAVANGASIVNASWGISCYSQALFDEISAAGDSGVIFVSASGNDGMNTDSEYSYPSVYDLPNLVSVAATTHQDELATFSNFGLRTVHLAAPGSNIFSTFFLTSDPNNTARYAYQNGTSMAAPHVAGALALLKAQKPTLPYQAILAALYAGTDRIPALAGKCATGGRLNVNNSLNLVSGAPLNDSFANRETIVKTGQPVYGVSSFATHEPGEPNHAGGSGTHSLWWTWTADFSGRVNVTTADSSFNTVVEIYIGSAIESLASVAANDNSGLSAEGAETSSVTFEAVRGTSYQIAVDGADSSASGGIHLQIFQVAGNDLFERSYRFDGDFIGNVTKNGSAEKEASEPLHADTAGGRSLWWTWIAPASGAFTLSTSGSSFDTLLAVYTGSSVSSVSEVASNDDDANGTAGNTSLVKFNASAGTEYRIAVDGKNGDSGLIRLAGSYDYAITDLGTLSGLHSHARRIAENGDIIGYAYNFPQPEPSSQKRALWWRNGLLYDISRHPTISQAFGLNESGVIVGHDGAIGGPSVPIEQGFVYDIANGHQPFINSSQPNRVFGINDLGYIVGDSNYPSSGTTGSKGIVLTPNGQLITIDSPFGATSTYSRDINRHAEVAGYARTSSSFTAQFNAIFWSGVNGFSTPISLGTFGGTGSVAVDINDHADVVGTAHRISNRLIPPFLWSDGRMMPLASFGCGGGTARSINNRRTIVGSIRSPSGVQIAFLYRDGVMIDLNTLLPNGSDWVLNEASDINEKGQIVGYGTYQGLQRAFLLNPPALLKITSPARATSGEFTFSINGPAGMNCDIEASSDLQTWSLQGTRTIAGGAASYGDSSAIGQTERYYRVRETSGAARSINAVGFLERSYPDNYSLVANPFTLPNLRISDVLPNAADGTAVLRWDEQNQAFVDHTLFIAGAGWIGRPDQKFNAGEGVFVFFPAATSVTFVGEVPQGVLTMEMPAGISFRGSLGLPPASLGTLNFPVESGDTVRFWNATAYQYDSPYTYTDTGWSPNDPTPSAAQGFMVQRAHKATWTRNFSIW